MAFYIRKAGDMLRSVYDPNNDGKIGAAQTVGIVKNTEFDGKFDTRNTTQFPGKFNTNFEGKINRAGHVYIAGDTVALEIPNLLLTSTSITLVKIAELIIPAAHAPISNSVNVDWEFNVATAGTTVNTQLRVNGIPVGGLETTNSSTFTKVEGSLIQLSGGDRVQVYGKTANTAVRVQVRNMRLKATVIPNTFAHVK